MSENLRQNLLQLLEQVCVGDKAIDGLKQAAFNELKALLLLVPQLGNDVQSPDTSRRNSTAGVTANKVITAFSLACGDILMHDSQQQNVMSLLELLLELLENGCVDDSFVVEQFENAVQMQTVEDAAETLEFIGKHLKQINVNFQPRRGATLIMLRMCNEFLRRLSAVHFESHVQMAGTVMRLLSASVSLDHTTQTHSNYNTDNVTEFVQDGSDEYVKFWKCQEYFADPRGHLLSFTGDSRTNAMASMQQCVEQCCQLIIDAVGADSSVELPETLKYSTAQELFEVQLADPHFQLSIMLQCLIFLRMLRAELQKSTDKDTHTANLQWISSVAHPLLQALPRVVGVREDVGQVVRAMFTGEDGWLRAADNGFKLPPKRERIDLSGVNPMQPPPAVKRFKSRATAANRAMHALWRPVDVAKLPLMTVRAPTVDERMAELREQMDPAAGIESEYRLSRNQLWSWQCSRALMSQAASSGLADNPRQLLDDKGLFSAELLIKRVDGNAE